jgi:hypothetical protein
MFKMIKGLKFQLFCFQKSFQKPNLVLNKCIYNARIICNDNVTVTQRCSNDHVKFILIEMAYPVKSKTTLIRRLNPANNAENPARLLRFSCVINA